ncbi:MAG: hypothetical protein JW795_04290 [Chitinivibrionales bacterium]|nr:hypothetical protein [Chitinivibrionales bacterium]
MKRRNAQEKSWNVLEVHTDASKVALSPAATIEKRLVRPIIGTDEFCQCRDLPLDGKPFQQRFNPRNG